MIFPMPEEEDVDHLRNLDKDDILLDDSISLSELYN